MPIVLGIASPQCQVLSLCNKDFQGENRDFLSLKWLSTS